MKSAASGLFLLYLLRTFFYELFPEQVQALVWNIVGSATLLTLLYISVWRLKSYAVIAITVLWTYEEALVIFGSALRILNPEKQPEYYETLTQAMQFPFGLFSLSLCAGIAVLIYKESKSATHTRS